MVKKFIIVSIMLTVYAWGNSQTINFERQNLGRFIQRMYENTPFEGVQLMDTGKHQYLMAILSLDATAYSNVSSMNRVANVKANSMVSKFVNGSQISSSTILCLSYDADSLLTQCSSEEIIEEISVGYVKAVELFLSFKFRERTVFVFGTESHFQSK